jgi:hypothetical protein
MSSHSVERALFAISPRRYRQYRIQASTPAAQAELHSRREDRWRSHLQTVAADPTSASPLRTLVGAAGAGINGLASLFASVIGARENLDRDMPLDSSEEENQDEMD